ncbi:hypothetical protein BA190_32185 [Labrys sp. WJW]|uniref:hypothetical protein n=1 Tax=Labrys sp. WJW TaxID=1737983 RepID=UPI0008359812|nr:hypothetical protein [Labrys sp. WJW]OCC00835.1 hypothetical protein BA190_32185 [Labrys sp. WJW]
MFKTSVKLSGALLLAAALASCETAGMFPKPGEAYVKEVTVTATPNPRAAVPPGMETRLHATLASEAGHFPQTGAPKRVSIVMTGYHLKNPALSLLIGDQNYTSGTMTVIDLASGTPTKPVTLHVQDSGFPQGVVGAIQAATQNTSLVESRLVSATSTQALEKFYGTKLLKTHWSGVRSATAPQPVATPVQPAQPAPAAKPKIKSAKPAAVAGQPST